MWQDWLSQRRRKSPVAAAQQNPERPRSGNRQPLTLRLHAETAQTAGRLQTMSTDVDWSRQPSIYKLYPTVARLALTEQIDCDFPDTLEVVQRLSPHAAQAASCVDPARAKYTFMSHSRSLTTGPLPPMRF